MTRCEQAVVEELARQRPASGGWLRRLADLTESLPGLGNVDRFRDHAAVALG